MAIVKMFIISLVTFVKKDRILWNIRWKLFPQIKIIYFI